MRRKMPSVHLATGRTEFKPIFQPGTWSSIVLEVSAIYYLFMRLVNFMSTSQMEINGINGLNSIGQ